MEYWDLLSEYLDDLLPLPTPIKREELVPFDYYGIPEELRGSVIEKVLISSVSDILAPGDSRVLCPPLHGQ